MIRDPGYPCKPYSATGDVFWVGVFNCDSTLFTLEPLAGVGPGGSRIYGEIEVQPGAYTVVGFSLCKNVLTNWAVVIAGCGEDVCVNLLPRKFWHCLAETDIAIKLAEKGITYPFGSEPRKVTPEMREVLRKASEAIETLSNYFPRYRPPVSVDDLRKAEAPEELIRLWEDLQRRVCCVEFEGLHLGTVYHVGDTFTDSCARITVKPFQWSNTQWTKTGFARVENEGLAGISGQEMEVNNVNLAFDFGGPCRGLSLNFGEYGGNLNVEINCQFRNFENFTDINGATMDGVRVCPERFW